MTNQQPPKPPMIPLEIGTFIMIAAIVGFIMIVTIVGSILYAYDSWQALW